MSSWFVPPIVVPAGLIAVLVVYIAFNGIV